MQHSSTSSRPAGQQKANGRPRNTPAQGLPKYTYIRSGSVYHVSRKGKWVNLGKDLSVAIASAQKLNAGMPPSGTMGYWIERWIAEDLEPRESWGDLAKRTLSDYKKYSEKIKVYFGKMKPSSIQSPHVTAYVKLGKQAGRAVQCNREKAALSICFTWMIANGHGGVKSNPCKGVKKNSEVARARYITDEEYKKVHKHSSTVVRVMLELIYRTLQRPGDILKWTAAANLKTVNGTEVLSFIQSKTQKKMNILITPQLKSLFEAMRVERGEVKSEYLVYAEDGQPYTDAGISSMTRRHIEEAEIADMTPYDLKAKGASDMAKAAGGATRKIMYLCGHTSIATTERYIRDHDVTPVESNETVIELTSVRREKKVRSDKKAA